MIVQALISALICFATIMSLFPSVRVKFTEMMEWPSTQMICDILVTTGAHFAYRQWAFPYIRRGWRRIAGVSYEAQSGTIRVVRPGSSRRRRGIAMSLDEFHAMVNAEAAERERRRLQVVRPKIIPDLSGLRDGPAVVHPSPIEAQSDIVHTDPITTEQLSVDTAPVTQAEVVEWTVADLLNRKVLVNQIVVKEQSAGSEVLSIKLPSIWNTSSNSSVAKRVLKMFTMVRGQVRVTLAASSNANIGGEVILYYDPYNRIHAATSSVSKANATACEHVLMSLCEDKEVALDLDLMTASAFISNDFGALASSVFGTVSVMLGSTPAIGATMKGVTLSLYIEFKQGAVAGIVDPEFASATYIDAQSSMVPTSGAPFCAPVSRRQVHTLSSFANVLTSTNGYTVGDYASRRSFVKAITWTSDDEYGKCLDTVPVHPCDNSRVSLVRKDKSCFGVTTSCLGFISSQFTYWGGDIIYTFRVPSTNTHSGTLAVAVHPGIGSVPASEYSEYPHTVWNIAEDRELVLEIKYLSPTEWTLTSANGVFRDITGTKNGTIAIYNVAAIHSPMFTTSNIQVQVYVQASPSYRLCEPSCSPVKALNRFAMEAQASVVLNRVGMHKSLVMSAENPSCAELGQRMSVLPMQPTLSKDSALIIPVRVGVPNGIDDLTYLSRGFAFGRGSMVYNFNVDTLDCTETREEICVSYYPTLTVNQRDLAKPYLVVPGSDVPSKIRGTSTAISIDTSVNGNLSVVVPYRSTYNALYLPLVMKPAKETARFPLMSTYMGCLVVTVPKGLTNHQVTIARGLGSDYEFFSPTAFSPLIVAKEIAISKGKKKEEASGSGQEIEAQAALSWKPFKKVMTGLRNVGELGDIKNPSSSDFSSGSSTSDSRPSKARGFRTLYRDICEVVDNVKEYTTTGIEERVTNSMVQAGEQIAKGYLQAAYEYVQSHQVILAAMKLFILLAGLIGVRYLRVSQTVKQILSAVIMSFMTIVSGALGVSIQEALKTYMVQPTAQSGPWQGVLIEIVTGIISVICIAMGIKNTSGRLDAITAIATQARNIGWFKQGFEALFALRSSIQEVFDTADVPEKVKSIFRSFTEDVPGIWEEALELLDPSMRIEVLSDEAKRERVLHVYVKLKALVSETSGSKIPMDAKIVLRQLFQKVETLRAEVLDYHMKGDFRIDPFHISVYGRPKIGKSTMMHNIIRDVFHIKGWAYDNMTYVVNPTMKHFDNYLGQKAVVFDDLGAIAGPNVEESDLGRMMSMKSNQRLKLPMAKLEEKGREFTSQLLVSATNVKVYARQGFADAGALNRRRDILLEADRVRDGEQPGSMQGPFVGDYEGTDTRFRILNSLTGDIESGWMSYGDIMRAMRPRIEAHFRYQDRLREQSALAGPTAEFVAQSEISNHDLYLSMKVRELARIPEEDIVAAMHHWESAQVVLITRGERLSKVYPLVDLFFRARKYREIMSTSHKSLSRRMREICRDVVEEYPQELTIMAYALVGSIILYVGLKWWFKTSPTEAESVVDSVRDRQHATAKVEPESVIDTIKERVYSTAKVEPESVIDSVRDIRVQQVHVEPESIIDNVRDRVHFPRTSVSPEGDISKVPLVKDEKYGTLASREKLDSYAGLGIVDTPLKRYYISEIEAQATIDHAARDALISSLDNMAELELNAGGRFISIKGIFACDRFVIVPMHFWTTPSIKEGEVFTVRCFGQEKQQCFNPDRLEQLGTSDLSVYYMSERVAKAKDIVKYIASKATHAKFVPTSGNLVGIFYEKGRVMVNKFSLVRIAQSATIQYRAGQSVNVLKGYTYRAETAVGDCGSLLVSNSTNSSEKFIGLHVAGRRNGEESFSEKLIKESVQEAIKRLEDRLDVKRTGSTIALAEEIQAQGLITDEKPYWGISKLHPGISVFGTLASKYLRRSPSKSAIVPTILDSLLNTPSPAEPAVLSDYHPQANHQSILMKQVSGYGQETVPFQDRHYSLIEAHLTKMYKKLQGDVVRPDGKLRVLTIDEAINGIPGVPHMDRMNMSTSEGVLWTAGRGPSDHNKKWLFTLEKREDGSEYYVPCAGLVAEVERLVDRASRGELSAILCQENLKDERRAIKHTRNLQNDPNFCPKTRSFTICPVSYTIAVRMFALAFVQMVERNREDVAPQVGIDPCSADWTQMYEALRSKSEFAVAGDYGNYDRGNPAENLAASNRIINAVYDDEPEIQMIRHTLLSMAYDHMSVVHNLVVHIDKGLPSGYPLTSMVNSIDNEIYLRMAWLNTVPLHMRSMEEFDRRVLLKVYGDDHIAAIQKEALEFYNMNTIGRFFEDHGISYTTEAKESWKTAEPYQALEDVRFLKRGFVYDQEARAMLAPLEKATIESRYRMYMKTAYVDHDTMVTELVECSLVDAMMHGKKYFEDLYTEIFEALKRGGEQRLMPVTSYESQKMRWNAGVNGEILYQPYHGRSGVGI